MEVWLDLTVVCFEKRRQLGPISGGSNLIYMFMVILRVQSCKIAAFGSRMTPEREAIWILNRLNSRVGIFSVE